MKSKSSHAPARPMRCAVYTRKSSEEGLDRDFNSLDAQRESCEDFIRSQKHQGWRVIETPYDDPAYSGGTMERPALQQLLGDIRKRKIDVVVVYKVDRLTRSLADFAKIVEIFDQHGTSFVSITQQFNTTTSMGRLTLNVLLSFAQFEREVTGERIRDKIAASKKKGMWMGGTVPLGYDVRDRKLIINMAEAKTVRTIFQRYIELGCVSRLKETLDAQGMVSKHRITQSGRRSGGKPFSRGMLYRLLQNPLYLGEIRHQGKTYPGEHQAIIDRSVWDQAQKRLVTNRVERRTGSHARHPSLLAGLLYDDQGECMTPSHANKHGKRYRYYVSLSLIKQPKRLATGGRRIAAGEIEQLVSERIQALLADEMQMSNAIDPLIADPLAQQRALKQAAQLASRWPDHALSERRAVLMNWISRIDVHRGRVDIVLRRDRLVAMLSGTEVDPPLDSSSSKLTLSVPATYKRTGIEMKLIVNGAMGNRRGEQADPSLVKLVIKAHQLKEIFLHNDGHTLKELAGQNRINPSYFTRLVRLTFLAPDITQAILEGRQPVGLTATRLMRNTRFPISWPEQRKLLGFA